MSQNYVVYLWMILKVGQKNKIDIEKYLSVFLKLIQDNPEIPVFFKILTLTLTLKTIDFEIVRNIFK